MNEKKLITPWDGHWREGEYLGFVRWSLGQQHARDEYRKATGDTFEIALNSPEDDALAYIQRFPDWLAANVFGMPDSVGEPEIYQTKRTVH